MSMYLGDFLSQQTVRFGWTTNDGAGSGATRTVDGTISVYKDGGTTQSTAGITDTEDFDGVTGVHQLTIVTTDPFYATGSDYMVVLSGATVDGISSVVAVLAHFSIENRTANVDRLDGDAQSLTDLKDFADAGYDPGTNKVQGVVLVDTTTTNTDMRGTDGVDTSPMRGTDNALLAASAPTNWSALLINASGHVSRVTLCDTTTTNTDMRGTDGVDTAPMRGTDNAFLAASAPANFSAMLISAGGVASSDVVAFQGFTIPGAGMIENDGTGDGRWTTKALEQAPSTGGGTDWTAGEREQIRYRLQFDGTQTAPAASAPLQLQVDTRALNGSAQSAQDLQDFADQGYDPATNKVEGVKLVDTTTTNTDMRGTDGAATPGDAMDLVTGAIDAASIAATGGNAFADYTLRRTIANALASSVGDAKTFRSLVGAASKLCNRVRSNAGTLEIYEPDDSTLLGTQTLTTDAAADPIIEADTV